MIDEIEDVLGRGAEAAGERSRLESRRERDKLDRIGVPGMRGGARAYATNRRVRLVEHAIAARLVTRDDLPLLDSEAAASGEDDA